MKFALTKGPFIRNKRSTTGIMLELFAVLVVVWLAAVISYSVKYDFSVGLKAILLVVVSLVTTLAIDVIMALIKGKRKFKDIFHFVLTSYSYVTSIIFTLCLPAGVSYYVLIVGSIVATLLGKYVFGGFGYNIFNPAIIGRIFVGLAFGASLKYGIEKETFDFVTSSTVTQNVDWSLGVVPTGFDLKTILFGGYEGAMGETFTLLLVACAIYLIVRGIINIRLVGSYLVTVTCISFFLGLLYAPGNVLNYTLLQLATGGLMFGAVFMVTDPVTSPKSMNGKIIYGIGIGCLTMLIRVNASYPEGVMFSIALMNMLTPLIDSCIKGNTFANVGKRWAVICAFLIGSIGLNVGFNALYPLNNGEENVLLETFGKTANIKNLSNDLKEEDKAKGFNALYKVKNSDGVYYVYDITIKDSYGGEQSNFILGIDEEGKIAKLRFVSYGDEYAEKYDSKYEEKVEGKNKLYNVDKVAGATLTGNAIRDAVNAAIEHFGGVK